MTPRARASDPHTSRIAGESVPGGIDFRVLAACVLLGVFHDGQVAARIGGERSVVARRRLELEEHGLVIRLRDRTGKEVTTIGSKGRPVILFQITDEGVRVMDEELGRRFA